MKSITIRDSVSNIPIFNIIFYKSLYFVSIGILLTTVFFNIFFGLAFFGIALFFKYKISNLSTFIQKEPNEVIFDLQNNKITIKKDLHQPVVVHFTKIDRIFFGDFLGDYKIIAIVDGKRVKIPIFNLSRSEVLLKLNELADLLGVPRNYFVEFSAVNNFSSFNDRVRVSNYISMLGIMFLLLFVNWFWVFSNDVYTGYRNTLQAVSLESMREIDGMLDYSKDVNSSFSLVSSDGVRDFSCFSFDKMSQIECLTILSEFSGEQVSVLYKEDVYGKNEVFQLTKDDNNLISFDNSATKYNEFQKTKFKKVVKGISFNVVLLWFIIWVAYILFKLSSLIKNKKIG